VIAQGKLTKINDELDDLETSDPLLPPDLDAARALEVVPVHDHVHGQVERDDDPRDGSRANELGVAKQGGGTMVVAVEERCMSLVRSRPIALLLSRLTQGLLLEEQEDSVEKLEVLGQVVELRTCVSD